MNKKVLKIAPVCLLAVVGMASCGTDNNSESIPEKFDPKTMTDFLNHFNAGDEVNKADALTLYNTGVIDSKDEDITNATHQELIFMPYWSLSGGQDESVYAQNVQKSDISEYFKKYNNGVYEVGEDYTKYGYDSSTITEEDDDGIAKTPTQYTSVGFIEVGNENVDYTYTRNADIENPYSFTDSHEVNEDILARLADAGAISSVAINIKNDVTESFSYYAANWTDLTSVETFKAGKTEEGGFYISFTGDLCMKLYSAERLWGWTYADNDSNYEYPLEKSSNMFNGMYVDRRIRFMYDVNIDKDGFITSSTGIYFSYWTTLYKDTQWAKGDELPSYPLSADTIEELTSDPERLIVPEVLYYDNGTTRENPYTGTTYDDYLPYEVEIVTSNGVDNGDATELPNKTLYRTQDGTDVGAWISVLDLFED